MVVDVIARLTTGVSAGFTFEYTGGAGKSDGSKFVAALIAACTSCSATSSDKSSVNCSVITEDPAELLLLI